MLYPVLDHSIQEWLRDDLQCHFSSLLGWCWNDFRMTPQIALYVLGSRHCQCRNLFELSLAKALLQNCKSVSEVTSFNSQCSLRREGSIFKRFMLAWIYLTYLNFTLERRERRKVKNNFLIKEITKKIDSTCLKVASICASNPELPIQKFPDTKAPNATISFVIIYFAEIVCRLISLWASSQAWLKTQTTTTKR